MRGNDSPAWTSPKTRRRRQAPQAGAFAMQRLPFLGVTQDAGSTQSAARRRKMRGNDSPSWTSSKARHRREAPHAGALATRRLPLLGITQDAGIDAKRRTPTQMRGNDSPS